MTDDGLMALADRVGYLGAFGLGNRDATLRDPLQALPRHLMTDAMNGPRLARLLDAAFDP
jgi:hypothetical protein